MKFIQLNDIIRLHEMLLNEYGGITGIKNKSLLESAYNKPFATFDGIDLYPTIYDKIATLTYSLINNHPMNDGNKRIGIATMLVLLKKNKIDIKYTQEELIELGLGIAENRFKEEYIKDWILRHQV